MTTITESNFTQVRNGIRLYVRLFGLDSDPLHAKYSSDEFDAVRALESVKLLIQESKRFVGKKKHVNATFDIIDDVKQDMAELLLIGDDDVATAVKRKRHLPLYHLVVCPVLDVFNDMTHAEVVENADKIIDYVIETAFNEDDYGTYDDALVAQVQTKALIRDREEQHKAELIARKKRNRKAAKLLEAELKESLEQEPA